jgi:hypothetical protein
MDRQYIRDHQVIERYLKGKLSAAEEQEFEEAYLADPKLLDEIELVERLGDGLKRHKASGAIAPRGGTAWFRALASPQLAAAASVLLVVSLVLTGALYRENASLRDSLANGAGLPLGRVTQLLPLLPVRGAPLITIDAPDANGLAVLLVDPGPTPHDLYRVTISRRENQSSTAVWTADAVAGYEDQLAISLPGRLLTPGDYDVVAEGRMKDWPAGRTSERVAQLAVKVIPRAPSH